MAPRHFESTLVEQPAIALFRAGTQTIKTTDTGFGAVPGSIVKADAFLVILESTRNASFMAKRFPSLVLVACLALFSGCLEFEQQTLTYRYDAKTDTLRIFQSYQGIFGADAKDRLSQKQKPEHNEQKKF